MFSEFRWFWGTRKGDTLSIQNILHNLCEINKNVLLKHLRATRLQFTNLIPTSGGDQNIDVCDASKVVIFSIDVCKILIPTLGEHQKYEFQRGYAHVGREMRFMLLASGGGQYFDRFEGTILIRVAGLAK